MVDDPEGVGVGRGVECCIRADRVGHPTASISVVQASRADACRARCFMLGRFSIVRLLVFALRLYRWTISPLLGPVCRFYPSCSRYAEGCLLTHGPFYGSILTIKRLAKCHPFHPGGYDPVPPVCSCDEPS